MRTNLLYCCILLLAVACQPDPQTDSQASKDSADLMAGKANMYVPVKLTTDVDQLSESDKQIIPILIEVAKIMDGLFWKESYPDELRVDESSLDEATKSFIKINYGPWDRLNGNAPFVAGVNAKPAGAGYYPLDMTQAEFDALEAPDKKSLYTMIRRDEQGALVTIPFHEYFAEEVQQAAALLREAAELAEDPGLANYFNLRAEALLTDEYDASDMAWLDLEDNTVDMIVGPIENYEDQLYGYKAAHEAYILVKDKEWSARLARYVSFLPELQEGMPVPAAYKAEQPGRDAQLNAYDVVYYAGDCNAGSKTIAVNLPNDEEIQKNKGTRRSQLKNAMRAKFDKILLPISTVLIAEDQRKHITFEAFFANTMFHEVAHGLGVKNTLDGSSTVREALKEQFSALEEGKADILGLYMVTQLFEKGEIEEGVLEDYYVTFLAGIFRSVRFGASSAHGKANMIRFNYFSEQNAFTRDQDSGTYRADIPAMRKAVAGLSTIILQLQGDGDYDGTKALLAEKGVIGPELQADLDRLSAAGIPVDIVFEQGASVLFGE